MSHEPEVLTVRELAEALNIGLNKAYRLCRERAVPCLRVGGHFRIPRRAFEEWLARAGGHEEEPRR